MKREYLRFTSSNDDSWNSFRSYGNENWSLMSMG